MDRTSLTTSKSPNPRNASTWDSFLGWPSDGGYAMASDISSKRVSEATYFPTPEYLSGVGNINRRKASVWDATGSTTYTRASTPWDSLPGWQPGNPVLEFFSSTGDIARRKASVQDTIIAAKETIIGNINRRKASVCDTQASNTHNTTKETNAPIWDNATLTMSRTQASVARIAGLKATALLYPKCDKFSEVLPAHQVFKLGWTSVVVDMATSSSIAALNGDASSSDNNRDFFAGNINYIFELHDGKDNLAMADIEAIMYVYGVENTSAQDILKRTRPSNRGLFNMNSYNKQILLDSTIKFSPMKEPLCILRHASHCYQENLLSPLHFAGYIINLFKRRYVGFEPRFMILGMYSILGVLEGFIDRKLITKDVETFVNLWTVDNPNKAQNLINIINNDHGGTISCYRFYTLLYRQNMFRKQLIEMFDTQGQQNPSMFFFLIDKDNDGFLSNADLCNFAAIFGRAPTDEAIDRVTRKLDKDGDGKVSLEDFREAMELVLDGMTWEFWLVAILFTLDL